MISPRFPVTAFVLIIAPAIGPGRDMSLSSARAMRGLNRTFAGIFALLAGRLAPERA